MEQRHKADSRLRRAWRETNRSLSQGRRNWRKTSKNLVSSWQRILTFIGGDRVIVDPALPVESRPPSPRWTGGGARLSTRPHLFPVSGSAVLLLSHHDYDKRIRQ